MGEIIVCFVVGLARAVGSLLLVALWISFTLLVAYLLWRLSSGIDTSQEIPGVPGRPAA